MGARSAVIIVSTPSWTVVQSLDLVSHILGFEPGVCCNWLGAGTKRDAGRFQSAGGVLAWSETLHIDGGCICGSSPLANEKLRIGGSIEACVSTPYTSSKTHTGNRVGTFGSTAQWCFIAKTVSAMSPCSGLAPLFALLRAPALYAAVVKYWTKIPEGAVGHFERTKRLRCRHSEAAVVRQTGG